MPTQTQLEKEVDRHRVKLVLRALRQARWNFTLAAEALGVQRSWLYTLMHRSRELKQAWLRARRDALRASANQGV